MAETDSDEASNDGDEGAEEDDDEHPESGSDTAHALDGDKTNGGTASESAEELPPADVDKGISGGLDGVLDTGEEINEAGADDIADVDAERGDEEA